MKKVLGEILIQFIETHDSDDDQTALEEVAALLDELRYTKVRIQLEDDEGNVKEINGAYHWNTNIERIVE